MPNHAPGWPAVARDGGVALRLYLQQVQAVDAPPEAILRLLGRQLGGSATQRPDRAVGSADPVDPLTEGPGLPTPPPGVDGPWLLGHVREALLDGAQRTARGAWFTPQWLARRLVAAAQVTAPQRVLDPACGGGAFLLAAGEAFGDIHLAGRDIDPLAVEVTRAALALAGATDTDVVPADGLAPLETRYDLVIGNPPFLSQLRSATARDGPRRRMLQRRFGAAAAGYVDEAGLFLLATATDMLGEGGVAVLVLPEALLATAAAAELRREVARHCTVEVVWRDRDRTFPQTPTCAVRLVRRPGMARPSSAVPPAVAEERAHPSRRVCREVDAEAPKGDTPGSAAGPAEGDEAGQWSHMLAEGVPHVTLPPDLLTIGDLATATADFRDAYYVLARHVREGTDEVTAEGGHRLVPVGLIDPAHLRWGQVEVRFAKQIWRRPVAVGLPASFLDRRLGPKVLVATQSRVLEALVDDHGDLVPSTPVITVRTDRPWHVGAALTSPVPTAIAARRHAGAARSRQALKLSAKQVLALPMPATRSQTVPRPAAPSAAVAAEAVSPHWDAAAAAFRAAHGTMDASRRRNLLEHCGREMSLAYGVDDETLIAWWLGRLPSR